MLRIEIPADSVRSMNMPETKDFDGFLLDMNLMKMAAPQVPKMKLEIPDASKDYSFLFRLNPEHNLLSRLLTPV